MWSGRLATTDRRATVIGDGGLATLTDEDAPAPGTGRAPRSAASAATSTSPMARSSAGLVTAVAAGVGGGLVDEHIAYVTSDQAFRTPFARGTPSWRSSPIAKALRAALRERGVGRLTIKKRGVDVVPDQLRKRLDLHGEQEATIVLTRVAGHGTALLVRHLTGPAGQPIAGGRVVLPGDAVLQWVRVRRCAGPRP